MTELDAGRPAEGSDQDAIAQSVPAYVIQMSGVRAFQVSARRDRRDPSDTAEHPEPTVKAERVRDWMTPDRKRFRVVWAVTLVYPYSKAMVLHVECSVEGAFVSTTPVSARRFMSFKDREAFVLLWPYLRATAWELARLLEVRVPPLPLLDVRKVVGPRKRVAQPPVESQD
jgi:hypothetical protein